jgi:hypothetical protein
VLGERPSHPLRNAALDLTLDDHGIAHKREPLLSPQLRGARVCDASDGEIVDERDCAKIASFT